MTASQFTFDFRYIGFKNAPGSTWELRAGIQRLAVFQIEDNDTKDWELIISCTTPLMRIHTLEPIDAALQELEADFDKIRNRLKEIAVLEKPSGGIQEGVSRFLCDHYELLIKVSSEIELKLLSMRLKAMADQLASRVDLFQRIRNRFT